MPGRPLVAFQQQRQNAKKRGITWDLTLKEWWDIWDASGRWSQRGRGRDLYVMSRKHDTGSYAVDNCFIQQGIENNRNAPNRDAKLPALIASHHARRKDKTLPIGVQRVRGYTGTRGGNQFYVYKGIKGKVTYIGAYQTIEEASAAYLTA